MKHSCICSKQIPGQSGVYKQDRLNKANNGKLEALLRKLAGYSKSVKTGTFKWRKSKDVPIFLKKFDAVQARTAKSKLLLSKNWESCDSGEISQPCDKTP